MKSYTLHAEKEEERISNLLLHNLAIQKLKSKIQQVLRLKMSHPILVSIIVVDQKIETLIMLECSHSNRMKIYKINTAPNHIQDDDILRLEQNGFKPCIYPLSLKEDITHS